MQKDRIPAGHGMPTIPQRMTARQESRNSTNTYSTPTHQHPHPHAHAHAHSTATHHVQPPGQGGVGSSGVGGGQNSKIAEQGRTASSRRHPLPNVQGQRIEYGSQPLREKGGGGSGNADAVRGVVEREREVKYVVYLKLPFAREGFVDPPQVDWDGNKERVLWRILSRTTRNQGIDWNHLAQQFQVSRAFLLQQAAWLYERELSQVRAQMRKGMGGATGIPNMPSGTMTGGASPRPSSPASIAMGMVGDTRMARTGSGGSYEPPKIYSQFSLRGPASAAMIQATHMPVRNRLSGQGTPTHPTAITQPMSRTPSTQTARPSSQASFQPPTRFANPLPQQQQYQHDIRNSVAIPATGRIYSSASSSGDGDDDDDDDSDDSIMGSSKRKNKGSGGGLFGDDEDEEEEEIYLPFSRAKIDSSASMDEDELGTATLRGVRKRKSLGGASGGTEPAKQDSDQGTRINPRRQSSEASSTSTTKQAHGSSNAVAQRKLTASGGAESSPSMGSSFSDLSDASISQSAMEDAYLSNMRAAGVGSMASRMSVLGLGLGR